MSPGPRPDRGQNDALPFLFLLPLFHPGSFGPGGYWGGAPLTLPSPVCLSSPPLPFYPKTPRFFFVARCPIPDPSSPFFIFPGRRPLGPPGPVFGFPPHARFAGGAPLHAKGKGWKRGRADEEGQGVFFPGGRGASGQKSHRGGNLLSPGQIQVIREGIWPFFPGEKGKVPKTPKIFEFCFLG